MLVYWTWITKKQNPNKKPNYNLRRGLVLGGAVVALTGGVLKGSSDKHSAPVSGIDADPALAYRIEAGDTEWKLAQQIAPNKDPREVVYDIDKVLPHDASHANHTLQPGDVIGYTASGQIKSYDEANSGNG